MADRIVDEDTPNGSVEDSGHRDEVHVPQFPEERAETS